MLKLPKSLPRRLALLGLGPFFIVAGANHFLSPDFYLAMMPPWLPAHSELVWISGLCEILGGIGVMVPITRSRAGWGLVALLIAIFPANVYMALNPELFAEIPRAALYGRLPFQAVFIAWAWWATRPDSEEPAGAT
jgi:uncharacterized membrane protein